MFTVNQGELVVLLLKFKKFHLHLTKNDLESLTRLFSSRCFCYFLLDLLILMVKFSTI